MKRLIQLCAGVVLAVSTAFATAAPALTPVQLEVGDFKLCSNFVTEETGYWLECLPSWSEGALPPPDEGDPTILFTDIINGPDTGIGDGLGSGAIVTIWAQNIGSTQGASTAEFTDSTGTTRPAYVYYWKDADGVAPSGPAELFRSHGMQEVAISIPDGANGPGLIKLTVGGDATYATFLVRSGQIYHVDPAGGSSVGSDANDGSFNNKWATVAHSVLEATAPGTLVYIHEGTVGTADAACVIPDGDDAACRQRGIYNNNDLADSTLNNQYAYIAYPGTPPLIQGTAAVGVRNLEAFVFSKLDINASNWATVDANGQISNRKFEATWGIQTAPQGRQVGNAITDIPGWCASGLQGAIRGDSEFGDKVSNTKIIGNHIYDYGCAASDRLHHTTYMSIRSGPADEQIVAWEFGYNFLENNDPKNGIHQFDQDTGCGTLITDLLIHNNVIIGQGGAAINVGLSGCSTSWPTKIWNNVMIDVGRAADWDGVDPNTTQAAGPSCIKIRGNPGDVEVFNNTCIDWDLQDLPISTKSCLGYEGGVENINLTFRDNICVTSEDKKFFDEENLSGGSGLPTTTFDNNVFYSSFGGTKVNAIVPSGSTNNIETDPLLTVNGARITVGVGSPIINQSTSEISRDVEGVIRGATSNIGANN